MMYDGMLMLYFSFIVIVPSELNGYDCGLFVFR